MRDVHTILGTAALNTQPSEASAKAAAITIHVNSLERTSALTHRDFSMHQLLHLPEDLRAALYKTWDPETGLSADTIRVLLVRVGTPLESIARECGESLHYLHHVCKRIRRNARVEAAISRHLQTLGLTPDIIWGPEGPKRPSVRSLPEAFQSIPAFAGRLLKQKHTLALLVDCETTGLNPKQHGVLEIAMLQVVLVRGAGHTDLLGGLAGYSTLVDPGDSRIDPFAMRVHRIKLESCTGRRIDLRRAHKLISESEVVIAHNAPFDRGFLARVLPELDDKRWACSSRGIAWEEMGFQSRKLGNLAAALGVPRPSHRAAGDVASLYHILASRLPDGYKAIHHLLALKSNL